MKRTCALHSLCSMAVRVNDKSSDSDSDSSLVRAFVVTFCGELGRYIPHVRRLYSGFSRSHFIPSTYLRENEIAPSSSITLLILQSTTSP